MSTGRRIDVDVGGVPVPTYLATPSDPSLDRSLRNIILYFPDVFGAFYPNSHLQDYFATQGFTVLGIDYFLGDPYALHVNDPNFDRPTWGEKSVHQAKAFTPGWVDAVRQRYEMNDAFKSDLRRSVEDALSAKKATYYL
ncbi:hypothetical protein F5141DRAFT_1218148 [Pisolithus sp. B1]|nr:hypothetical protein F5141DRAFT_1218148 [Pisolithus sp. B1]